MDFTPELNAYVLAQATPDDDLLAELTKTAQATLQNPQMLSGTVEGRFLELLVFATGTKRILEFGTYAGFSALTMAAALPEDGRLTTLELSQEHADFARGFFDRSPHGHKIEILVGPALDSARSLEGPFDLVFIDADKDGYVDYYEVALEKLAPRGLIVADNTLANGGVVDANATGNAVGIKRFNDHVRADTRVRSVLLTVRDGVTLVRHANAG
jgi:caffeoyl-CoA O-methyltransferase